MKKDVLKFALGLGIGALGGLLKLMNKLDALIFETLIRNNHQQL